MTAQTEAMHRPSHFNHHPFTEEGVLARITETGFKYQPRNLAKQFRVQTSAMRTMLNKLVEQGLIQIGKDSGRVVYFVPREEAPEPVPEGVAGYRRSTEFRPLVGYEARMREFAGGRVA
jgi:hypothetical protein